ncbi:hypothetical protein Ga0074812_102433 [Parafrankia irregularis]|uniref:Uncharacterized protein n=1 Tax=Parafrankia irregularis TaxID=795642 RepID=A0A0S4QG87_9ACTN|nr:hypothetical protein Ga0074812_102433 [Parafrankia irregularis]
MAARAADVGHPHTAGVGCSAAARRSNDTYRSTSQPLIRVGRCHMVAVRMSVGAAGTARPTQQGRRGRRDGQAHAARASATASTTTACSCRPLAEAGSAAARRRSVSGSAPQPADRPCLVLVVDAEILG